MPSAVSNSGIRDNHRRGLVADFLKAKIRDGSQLSVVSAYFTIYAYEALREHLDQIAHLDFLFGEPHFIAALDPEKTEKKAFILDGNGLQLANSLQQKRVARECAAWIQAKVDIRSVRQAQFLHGKMYHIANAGVEEAILGSSNFTVRGLGLGAGNNNIELNLEVDSGRDRRDLKTWFDELWNDTALVADVKDEVLRYLDQLYQNHPPEGPKEEASGQGSVGIERGHEDVAGIMAGPLPQRRYEPLLPAPVGPACPVGPRQPPLWRAGAWRVPSMPAVRPRLPGASGGTGRAGLLHCQETPHDVVFNPHRIVRDAQHGEVHPLDHA